MKRVQDEVSFTAAPHDRIKHLRLSPTLSANAEAALKKKKQHSSGKSCWGGQNQQV